MQVFARHGVMPQERLTGANFYVSLCAEATIAPSAYEQDEFEGTVSYALLTSIVQQEMEQPSQLLEHVAYRIGQHILAECSTIANVTVKIEKENPPLGIQAQEIGIEITLSR